jgi:type I restriction enzyme, S subunit
VKQWSSTPLGELCDVQLGRTPARANKAYWDERRETGNVWLSIADMLNTEDNLVTDSEEYLSDSGAAICEPVKNGTLLVSFKLTLGRLAFAGRDLYTNEAIAALTGLDEHRVCKEFLFYYLQFFDWQKAAEGEDKIKGKTLNKAKVKQLEVRFPASIPEQRRLVASLDQALDGIATAKANAERNLQSARQVFESHLDVVFTKRDGWVEKRLEDVSLVFGRGRSRHRPRNDPKLYGGKYPFIQTGDVRGSDHLITSYSQTYNEEGLAQSKLWPAGTLCITIAANIAETGILGFDACFPDSVIGVVVNPRLTSNKFLEYLLQSVKAKLKAQGKGSAQDNINMGTFENQTFPFPDDPKVQERVVATFDGLREETARLEAVYRRKADALDELKKSLLHQAFSGAL